MYNGVCLSDFVWEAPVGSTRYYFICLSRVCLILGEISTDGFLLLFGLLIGYTLWLGYSCIYA